MAEPEISPVGYYMLHSCGDSADHQDACDGVFVWASSSEEALSLDPEKHRDPETVEVERVAEADKFHQALGTRWGNNWGANGVEEERAYRSILFREEGASSCDTCGLYEFSKVPESKVCRECTQCAECGCACGEDLAEASNVFASVATTLAVAMIEANELTTSTTDNGEAAEGVSFRLLKACQESLRALEPHISHSVKTELQAKYGESLAALRTTLAKERP